MPVPHMHIRPAPWACGHGARTAEEQDVALSQQPLAADGVMHLAMAPAGRAAGWGGVTPCTPLLYRASRAGDLLKRGKVSSRQRKSSVDSTQALGSCQNDNGPENWPAGRAPDRLAKRRPRQRPRRQAGAAHDALAELT